MRRRKKPGAKEELLSHDSLLVENPQQYKGNWKQMLKSDRIHIELGIGRGQFINTLAEQNNDIGYIGIEIKEEILLDAVKKTVDEGLDNIKYLWVDINDIDTIFDENEIERIYINFCDPWPKKRHSRRRLTYREFLNKYSKILKNEGEIHFKTDGEELFEFSLNEICQSQNLFLRDVSLNLYRNEDIDTIKTEYEQKFISQSKNIYFLRGINNK
ncbi:tRNA (guanosine(46)-N7)-methyltransferase TrmB [Brassicibacter mesophilus]|uniref:tRNA (guanosine(46)-N7)-methyltransferase TrmB n=1 Tax=Brassicibacter mesophilus TaxID=745119 RepID=UPI003D1AA27E